MSVDRRRESALPALRGPGWALTLALVLGLVLGLGLLPRPGLSQSVAETPLPAPKSAPAAAPEKAAGESAGKPNFSVDGATLVYDTEKPTNDEIDSEDVEILRDTLRANPAITTLRINSGGGGVWAAKEMARIVLDFELDTEVDGECSSSCVRLFLAGKARRMTRGSKIGFHSKTWSARNIESYYDEWREDENWDTPFEFASWMYRDTYAEAYEEMVYTVSRGVDARFAIEMHAPRDTLWFPSRTELTKAGILRE